MLLIYLLPLGLILSAAGEALRSRAIAASANEEQIVSTRFDYASVALYAIGVGLLLIGVVSLFLR